MRGVKPPRYPTLWEAFVNTITFQQVSLQAASAIARRLIIASTDPLVHQGVQLYPFPSVEQVLGTTDATLRDIGFSVGKLATLRRVGDALRPQQGLLYYHLLLARLESRGELGLPSVSCGTS